MNLRKDKLCQASSSLYRHSQSFDQRGLNIGSDNCGHLRLQWLAGTILSRNRPNRHHWLFAYCPISRCTKSVFRLISQQDLLHCQTARYLQQEFEFGVTLSQTGYLYKAIGSCLPEEGGIHQVKHPRRKKERSTGFGVQNLEKFPWLGRPSLPNSLREGASLPWQAVNNEVKDRHCYYPEFYPLGNSNENQRYGITFLIFMLKTFLIHQIVSLDIRKKIQQK